MAVEIIYETHATSTDNEAGIASGWLPGRLSEEGQRQAKALGERRRHDALTAVFTSDLARAVETTEIAFAGRDVPIIQDRRLRECNYGALNGAPVTEVAKVRGQHVDVPFPGGQSYRQVVEETRSFLHDLAVSRDGQTILIVAHSANRWALNHLLKGVALEDLVGAPFNWQEGWWYSFNRQFH